MSRWLKEETSVRRVRARVTATLRRRSPPFLQYRPKTVRQVSPGILVVADAEDDDVPLIPLDPLDVLDEEALFVRFREELVEGRIVHLTEAEAEGVFDVVRVVLTKGDDA